MVKKPFLSTRSSGWRCHWYRRANTKHFTGNRRQYKKNGGLCVRSMKNLKLRKLLTSLWLFWAVEVHSPGNPDSSLSFRLPKAVCF